jgi:hypothetical protein
MLVDSQLGEQRLYAGERIDIGLGVPITSASPCNTVCASGVSNLAQIIRIVR